MVNGKAANNYFYFTFSIFRPFGTQHLKNGVSNGN